MKAPTMFVAGVLLAGLGLACSWSSRVLEASPLSAEPSKAVAAKATGTPLRADWRLGTPIAFERLTIFPVISDQPSTSAQFITLDEGLRSGKVTINEMARTSDRRSTAAARRRRGVTSLR